MKKLYALIVVLICLAPAVFSQNAPVTLAPYRHVALNGSVALPINALSTINTPVSAITLKFIFDSSKLSFGAGDVVPASEFAGASISVEQDTLIFAWWGQPAFVFQAGSPKTMFIINGTYLGPGECLLSFMDNGTSCEYANDLGIPLNDSPFSTYYKGGAVDANLSPVLNVPAVSHQCPGSTLDVPITVDGFKWLYGLNFALNFDPAVLTFTGVTLNGPFSNGSTITYAFGSLEQFYFSWVNNLGDFELPDGTVIATLHFTSNGGTSSLNFFDNGGSCEFSDIFANPQVDIPQADYYKDGSVQVNFPCTFSGSLPGQCLESTLALTGGFPAGGTYSGAGVNSLTGEFSSNAAGPGVHTITYTFTDPDNCTTSATNSIEVYPLLPVQDLGSAFHMCANQSVTLTAPQQYSGLTYNWSNGDSGPIAVITNNGTLYQNLNLTLTVEDTHGCVGIGNVSIELLASFTAQVDILEPIYCENGSNGQLTVALLNGVPPFNFEWSNGLTDQSIAGLSAGYYSVTITDSKGCIAMANGGGFSIGATLVDPGPFTLDLNSNPVTCFGGSDGSVLAIPGGSGQFPYLFEWNVVGSGDNLTGLSAGTYNVTVTDIHGCVVEGMIQVSQPDAYELLLVANAVTCFGLSDGSVTLQINGSGGVPPYQFAWSNGSTLQNINGLSAGEYFVTVLDANGCSPVGGGTSSVSYVFEEPADPGFSSHPIVISGVSLPSGNYQIGVFFDQGGSLVCGGYYSDQPSWDGSSAISFSAWEQNSPIDNGFFLGESFYWILRDIDNDLYFQVVPSFSFGGNTFDGGGSVVDGMTLVSLSGGAGAGVYSAMVTQPQPLSFQMNPSFKANGYSITCFGGSDGEILVTDINGGTPPYNYFWNGLPGGLLNSGLSAGVYQFELIDQFNCSLIQSVTLNEPSQLPSLALSATPIEICSGADVTVNYDLTYGQAPFTFYYFDGPTGTTISMPSNTLTGSFDLNIPASPGTYNYEWLYVVDAYGCIGSLNQNFSISVNPLPTVTGSASTDICLDGAVDREFVLTGNGPWSAQYSVYLDGGAVSSVSMNISSSPVNLSLNPVVGINEYVLSNIVDSKGCASLTNYTITIVGRPNPSVNLGDDQVICNGATLLLDAGLGSGYLWSDNSIGQTLLVDHSGTFAVTVTNQYGCQGYDEISIVEAVGLPISETFESGMPFGWTTSNAPLGIGWLSGDASSLYSDFFPVNAHTGSFVASNDDLAGPDNDASSDCIHLPIVDISGFSQSVLTFDAFFPTLNNDYGASGQVIIQSGGNTITYNLIASDNWQPGIVVGIPYSNCNTQISFCYNDGGNWASGFAIDNVNVTGISDVEVLVTSVPSICPGTYYPSISIINHSDVPVSNIPVAYQAGSFSGNGVYSAIIPVGGSANYNFANGFPLNAGETLTLNCSTSWVGDLNPANNADIISVNGFIPQGSAGLDDIICIGETGFLTAVDGVNYIWSTGATSATIGVNPLTTTDYSVTITDSNGCISSDVASVVVNIPLDVTLGSNFSICAGQSVVLNALGGPFVNYNWSNGSTGNPISVTPTGPFSVYSVTVTDGNGCSNFAQVTVTVMALPNASISGATEVCPGENATLTANGGVAYSWSTGSNSASIVAGNAGVYEVTVTGSNGCSTVVNHTLSIKPLPVVNGGSPQTVCNGQPATITVTGNADSYSWGIFGNGSSIQVSPNQTTTYTVVGTLNGCTNSSSVTVFVNPLPDPQITGDNTVCFGESTSFSATGGQTYLWSNGSTLSAISVSVAGAYVVTVTDGNGCSASTSVSLTVFALPVANAGSDKTVCYGNSAVLTASFNTGYSFTWSTGETTQSITVPGFAAQTYYLTVTDANNCSASDDVSVFVNDLPNPSISGNLEICFGGSTNLQALPNGLTYLWSNGSTAQNILVSPVISTAYSVTVTDGNSCRNSSSANVVVNSLPNFSSLQVSNVSCNGFGDGEIDLTMGNGIPPFVFSWSNGQLTEDITGLVPGTYSVTVTDSKNCFHSETFTITEPFVLTTNVQKLSDASCFGSSNGSVKVLASGGTQPYFYNWSNGTSTQENSNIAAGTYGITVVDANGCSAVNSIDVNQPIELTLGFTQQNVNCFGLSTGSIDLSVNGGTAPYSYAWTPALGNIQDPAGLSANLYQVTVTDGKGCVATSSIQITQPSSGLSVSIVLTTDNQFNGFDVSCSSSTDGQIVSSVNGGTSGYTYLWSNGLTTADVNVGASASGTIYKVTVTDINGCSAVSNSVTVTSPSPLGGSRNITRTCPGVSEGAITFNATGGVTPYSYYWSNGATANVNSGIPVGDYFLTVTDANGCTFSNPVAYSVGAYPAVLLSVSITNPLDCHNSVDGELTASASAGKAPYSYSWSSGFNGNPLTMVGPGNYFVTVTDDNGCKAVANANLIAPNPILISLVSQSNYNGYSIKCIGDANGSATVSASGGTGSLSYLWSNGVVTNALSNISAPGEYTLTVSDQNGCQAIFSLNFTRPTALVKSVAIVSPISCDEANDGIIQAVATGGALPYNFLWSGSGATTSTISGLAAGMYSVSINDANYCSSGPTLFNLTQPDTLTLTTSVSNFNGFSVSCFGGSNGWSQANPHGGTGPYSYSWSNGSTTSLANNLSAVVYSISVTDSRGCFASKTITLTQPSEISLLPTFSDYHGYNVSCLGNSDGSISVLPQGGVPGYSYLWSNSQTGSGISQLSAVAYGLTVTDFNGCKKSTSYLLTQPPLFSIQSIEAIVGASGYNVSCNGGSDGGANLTVGSGFAPYSYLWDNGSLMEDPNNLTAGMHFVTVTDDNDCVAVASVTLNQPDPISATYSVTDVKCFGQSNGSAALYPFGGVPSPGTPHYSYHWSTGATTQNLSNVPVGTYFVTITDSQGCTGIVSVNVSQPAFLSTEGVISNVTCFGYGNGSIDLQVTGGTAPYLYFWSNGATTQDLNGLNPGNFTVVVRDAHNCMAYSTIFTISQPAPFTATTAISSHVLCFGGNDGQISVSPAGGVGNYQFLWSNGATSSVAGGLIAGGYSVTVSDNNGCLAFAGPVQITEPTELLVSGFVIDKDGYGISCFGANDGEIQVNVTGGTVPYHYLWSNGSSSANLSNLVPGNYSLTVTDNHQCSKSIALLVTEPVAISINYSLSTVPCSGVADVDLSVNGMYGPFLFAWDNGQTIEDATGLTIGSHFVTITDTRGCSQVFEVVNDLPGPFSVILNTTDVSCFGSSDGAIVATPVGGAGPFSYMWIPGYESSNQISGLSSGPYFVFVEDANGCFLIEGTTINGPLSGLETTSNVTHVDCFGGTNGSIQLIVSGGYGNYSYLWSDGSTDQNRFGLSGGSYSVTISDFSGLSFTSNYCSIIRNFEVEEPAQALGIQYDYDPISCNGGTTVLTLSATGGTPSYFGVGTFVLGAGPYTLTVSDAHGCQASVSLVISEPPVLVAGPDYTPILCNGDMSNLTISALGGTPPYSGIGTFSVGPGVHSYSVTDSKGCSALVEVEILEPSVLDIQIGYSPISCFGGTTQVEVGGIGGTPPYNGTGTFQVGSDFHDFYITDANGCFSLASFYISEPDELVASVNNSEILCHGETSFVSVTAIGGTMPYVGTGIFEVGAGTYSYPVSDANGCQTTVHVDISEPNALVAGFNEDSPILCNGGLSLGYVYATGGTEPYFGVGGYDLPAGNYSFPVIDVNGCTVNVDVVISEPAVLSANAVASPILCAGGNSNVTVTAEGGTSPYFGVGIFSVGAGPYEFDVTDSNGCPATVNGVVNEPMPLHVSVQADPILCHGGLTEVDFTVDGGTPPYTISGSLVVGAGVHSYTVADANGCEENVTITLTEPAILTAPVEFSPILCNGELSSVTVTAVGGVGPYSGIGIYQFEAGMHSVLVTDANGCQTNAEFLITQPDQLFASYHFDPILCNGGTTFVNISGVGGFGPYSGIGSFEVGVGHYSYSITDANGCSANVEVDVVEPMPLVLEINYSPILCYGWTSTVSVVATGGTAPYVGIGEFDLPAGVSSILVSDANGCQQTGSIEILEPTPLVATFSYYGNVCEGQMASLEITATGGTPPYSGDGYFEVGPGQHPFTVFDSNGCTDSEIVLINEFQNLSIQLSSSPATCAQSGNGSAEVSITGGSGNYQILWSNGVTTNTNSAISAGSYYVSVVDILVPDCGVLVGEVTIQTLSDLSLNGTAGPVSCFGGTDGYVSISVSGGSVPYHFAWSNGSTVQNLNYLTAGLYSVVVTDALGCTVSGNFQVVEPDVLTIVETIDQVSCNGAGDGQIFVSGQGGNGGYYFLWNSLMPWQYVNTGINHTVIIPTNISLSGSISGLLPGDVIGVFFTNTSGMQQCGGYATWNGSMLNVAAWGSYTGNPDGFDYNETMMWKIWRSSTGLIYSAIPNYSGSPIPNSGQWLPNGLSMISSFSTIADNSASFYSNPVYSSLTPGTYTVIMTDAKGCNVTETYTITQPEVLGSSISGTNVNCNGGTNGTVNLSVYGGTAPYSFSWSNGSTTEDLNNIPAGAFVVTVTDFNGCQTINSISITQPTLLVMNATAHNITCWGYGNGSIEVSVSGGIAPYHFNWSNGSTTEDLASLVPGVYALAVTDNHGCQVLGSWTITQPNSISFSTQVAPISCFGGTTAINIVNLDGGTPPYYYLWSNGAQTPAISEVSAGVYSVTIHDVNGCASNFTQIISQPALLQSTISSSGVSCFGGTNGGVNLSVTGGTLPYSYSWSNGSLVEDLVNVPAGTYSVTITDLNGCVTLNSVEVGQPQVLAHNGYAHNVTCWGNGNGHVEISVSGGVAPYSYLWSNGSSLEDLVSLTPGIYSLTVFDSNGCQVYGSWTITQPNNIGIGTQVLPITCFGGTTNINISSLNGGTPPYSYQWSNGAQTQNVSGVTAGIYTVTVQDVNGCFNSNTRTITQPSQITPVISVVHGLSCFGDNDGSISATVTGGTTPYQSYQWDDDNGTNGLLVNNLSAGVYTLVVTDFKNCQVSSSFTLTQPQLLVSSGVATNVACFGLLTGSIDLSVSGGVLPYGYTWSNGSTIQDLSNIGPGAYSVVVTDANGCSTNSAFEISQPLLPLTVNLSTTNVTCFGGNNGSASLGVSGGTAPYVIDWNGVDPAHLFMGQYVVVVTDAHGCQVTTNFEILQPALLAVTGIPTNLNCNGNQSGSIITTVNGGSVPYYYNWSNGAVTSNLNGIAAGIYSLTVTDINFCTATATFTVAEPTAISVISQVSNYSGFGTSAFGVSDGYVNLTSISGGSAPYQFQWSNGSTATSISGLGAGNYSVIVSDANGCVLDLSFEIIQPPMPELAVATQFVNPNCYGECNGSVIAVASGGISPYSYLWSNGATTPAINGLCAGNYTVSVFDSTVDPPSQFTWNYPITSGNHSLLVFDGVVLVNGQPIQMGDVIGVFFTKPDGSLGCGGYMVYNGYLDAVAAMGDDTSTPEKDGFSNNEPFIWKVWLTSLGQEVEMTATYDLSSGFFPNGGNFVINGMSGVIAMTGTINNSGTLVSATVSLQNPQVLAMSGQVQHVSCYQGTNGSIDLMVSGGTAPYGYAWSNGSATEDLQNVPAGTYSVTVTDSHGCFVTGQFTIEQPTQLTTSLELVNPSCWGYLNGSINLTVQGGVLPYGFAWSNSAVTEDLSGLGIGSYSVVVTDGNGCVSSSSGTLTQPSTIAITTQVAPISCFGGTTNINITNLIGGTAPYSFLWSTGAVTQNLPGVTSGIYTVTVTDVNGCAYTSTRNINQPLQLIPTISLVAPISCYGQSDGILNVGVTGGTAPYSLIWNDDNSGTTNSISGLSAANYSLTVTDHKGCTEVASYEMVQPDPLVLNLNVTDVTCNSFANGALVSTVTGGTAPYFYNWSNGSTTFDNTSLVSGDYFVTVTDSRGCVINGGDFVDQPTLLVTEFNSTNVICNGQTNGTAQVTVYGGVAPYSINWNGVDAGAIPAGAYTVVVTDMNGCLVSIPYTITEPAPLAVNTLTSNALCYGQASGSVQYQVSGGTNPYYYHTMPGNYSSSHPEGLSAGHYEVTITDVNFCTITTAFDILQPDQLVASGTVSNYNGFGVSAYGAADGYIVVDNVAGGMAPYSFNWSDGSTTSSIYGLVAGTYDCFVADAHQCGVSLLFEITQPPMPELAISVEGTNLLCSSQCSGSANLNVIGGVPPISVLWSNGATTEDVDGLCAGTYTVTVTDASIAPAGVFDWTYANTGTSHIILIPDPGVTVNGQPLDNGDYIGVFYTNNDGSVSCGGYLQYTGTLDAIAAWGDDSTSPVKDGFGSGEAFIWKVFKVSTGQEVDMIPVYDPAFFNGGNYVNLGISGLTSLSGTSSTNLNSVVATVQITAPATLTTSAQVISPVLCNGGEATVSVSANGGVAPYTGTGTFQSVAGNFAYSVYDSNGCQVNGQILIGQPDLLTAHAQFDPISCYGGTTVVTVSGLGGTAPYTGIGTFVVSAGDYSYTIQDANGCVAEVSITVEQPSELTASSSFDPILCFGQPTYLNITAFGGVAPYYGNDVYTVYSGVHQFEVYDSNGCMTEVFVDVIEPAAIILGAEFDPITCHGGTTQINVTAQGGTPGYSGVGYYTVPAGNYVYGVTDGNGCESSIEVFVTEPDALVAEVTVAPALCYGESATVTVLANGGVGPYSGVGQFLVDVSMFNYAVTDFNGCSVSGNVMIDMPTPVSIEVSTSNVTCSGLGNGTASLAISGGVAPYAIGWNGFDPNALAPGSYSALVTDANGCENMVSFEISEPAPMVVSVLVNNPSCNGETGSATVSVIGGTSPYSFEWYGVDPSALVAGSYSVLVTDANGCSDVQNFQIAQPEPLTVTVNTTDATCSGYSNGTAQLTIGGGTPVYSVNWFGFDPMALASGSYAVEVVDANGCIASATFEIGEPDVPAISFVVSNITTCFGSSTGAIDLTVSGDYNFVTWSNGSGSEDLNGVPAGVYSVVVNYGAGCTVGGQAEITQPNVLVVNVIPYYVNGQYVGLFANASGGVAPYSYTWSNGIHFPSIRKLTIGNTYCVTVTDANGCVTTACGVYNPTSIAGGIGAGNVGKFDGKVPLHSITATVVDGSTIEITENGAYEWTGFETAGLENFIQLYPNPVREGRFTIDLTQVEFTSLRIEMMDAFGRIVLNQEVADNSMTQVSVETTGQKAGTYFVRIITENNVVISKPIILVD